MTDLNLVWQVGQSVWVSIPTTDSTSAIQDNQEERGTILKINKTTIQVELHVSKKKKCYKPELLRLDNNNLSKSTTPSQRSRRSAITPSPQQEEGGTTPAAQLTTAKSAKKVSVKSVASKDASNESTESSESDDDVQESKKASNFTAYEMEALSKAFLEHYENIEAPASPYSEKTNAKKKSVPIKKKAPAKKTKIVIQRADSDSDNEDDASDGGSSDVDSDRPFQIEYACTGRSTCRRCDTVIDKGAVRVSHAPLFRGKPGFRVYRHLHCSSFSPEIKRVQDVGGWRKLKAADRDALEKRIEASELEMEEEKKEISPDELVPVVFQGEMRTTPPAGLAANLLPFQVEGTSWMYHQEVHVLELRGGILADEMGMVRELM
jgi:SNF2 family DNA or RNA helicase